MNQYGLFGTNISHSLSPNLHLIFSKQTGHPMQYTIYETAADRFEIALSDFFKRGGAGANITAPFKGRACPFASSISERAKRLGAVNTLKKCADGSIQGTNTDGLGLVNDLQHLGLLQKRKTTVLIIGAGAAAASAVDALLEYEVRSITLLNRTLARAKALIKKMLYRQYAAASEAQVSLNLFVESNQRSSDLIINATTAGDEIGHFLKSFLPASASAFYYDMSYAPVPTPFLSWASQYTTNRYSSGLGMLVEQGALSFQWWHGVRPNAADARQQLSIIGACQPQ